MGGLGMGIGSWRGRAVAGAAALAALAVAAGCAPSPSCPSAIAVLTKIPTTVIDPAITLPETMSTAAAPLSTPRNRLVLLFSGTGTGPTAVSAIAKALAADGYHVLGVNYDSSLSTLKACPDKVVTTDPDCHRRFRAEEVFGEDVADPSGSSFDHSAIDVPIANSAMNSLMQQLDHMSTQFPAEGWGQFQAIEDGQCVRYSSTYDVCEPRWSSTIPIGFSQGAGVALYLSKFFDVDRVGMLSGPFDAFRRTTGAAFAAPWVSDGGFATPSSDMAIFSHVDDVSIFRHRAVADALGVAPIEATVTRSDRPFGGAQRLLTDVTPYQSTGDRSADAHNSTAANSCPWPTIHDGVWRYLASGE